MQSEKPRQKGGFYYRRTTGWSCLRVQRKMLTHSHNLIFTKAIPILMKLSDTCIFDSDAQIWRISDDVLNQNDTFLNILKNKDTRRHLMGRINNAASDVSLTDQHWCLISSPNISTPTINAENPKLIITGLLSFQAARLGGASISASNFVRVLGLLLYNFSDVNTYHNLNTFVWIWLHNLAT